MSDVVQNVKVRFVVEGSDLSTVDANLNKLTASELKLKEGLKQVDTQAKATNKTLQDETQKSAKAVEDSGKSFTDLSTKVKGLASQIPGAFQVEQVLGFAKASGSATAAIGGTSAAMNVLKVAFASTGIGLLVIALGSLVAYFKSTDEGATKLEGAMGAVSAVFSEVVGYVAELGSKIFEAFESVQNFQDGLSELGEFLLNNLFNRLKSFLVFGEAIGKLLTGDFKGALKTGADAILQLATGVTNITDKAAAFAEQIAKAAKEAYEYAIKLDAVNDAQREFNVQVSENNIRVVELIRQSKNHTLAIQERIDKLKEANKIDSQSLEGQLSIERRRLTLIQERNAREKAAINQRLNDDIANAKSEEKKIELRKKSLSIVDDLADEEAAQIIKINGLRQQSVALQERNNNSIAALTEEGIQKRLGLIKSTGTAEENIYKEQYAKREIDEKQFQDGITQSQLESLYTQKAFLEELGRDTVDIDKAIQDILIKQRSDADKEIAKNAKDASDRQRKEWEDDAKFYEALSKQQNEKDLKAKKDTEAQKALIVQESQTLISTIGNGFFQLSKDNLTNELSQIQYNKSQELAIVGENKQAQAVINAKYAKQEAELKTKQAKADRDQSIFNIGLATAVAIAKASPVIPLMAFAAAIGAIQLAFAASKPIPKFYNKGTKGVPGSDTTRDSVHAMLTPGEGVMPVDRMRDYKPAFDAIFDRKIPADLINSIVLNPSILNGKGGGNNESSERLLKSIDSKLDKIKTFEVSLDAKGFKSFLKSENAKTEIENNYARMK